MNKKYKLDKEDTIEILGKKLCRVVALIDIGKYVKAGDKGGYIESEDNLSQDGNAWVDDDAKVYEDALISGKTCISGNMVICGNARISKREDYFCVQSFGSAGRTTTFFRTENNWCVVCGCFLGTVEEFRQKVKDTHGDSLIAQEYLMIADLMELRIKRRNNEVKETLTIKM